MAFSLTAQKTTIVSEINKSELRKVKTSPPYYIACLHRLLSFLFRAPEREADQRRRSGRLDMDEGMSGFCIKGGGKCGRWNPTAEQVKVLTDLFRSGLRTPNTDQIQKISSQLSFYGKIESKNVFYWFQNHKARERQKKRRISVRELDLAPKHCPEAHQIAGREKALETLQLFPVHSCEEAEKVWSSRRETVFSHGFVGNDCPLLDLRLSS